MNKKIQDRIVHWLPVMVWFGLIFFLSSIPSSTIKKIPAIIVYFNIPEDWYLFWGHRVAHFVEYGVLGMLVIRAYSKETMRITLMTILGLSCCIFLSGLLDEWHQSFVPGRTLQLLDAIFDTICAMLGMLFYKMAVLNKYSSSHQKINGES